jgi:hypothetical protein
MQPYFFPYIGYFNLIFQTQKWIVFDVVQYNQKSWMNRNRILHPNNGWQYITAPVKKNSRDTLIKDIEITDKETILNRILGQLSHYKKKAKYYTSVIDLIIKGFNSTKSDKLTDLNISTLQAVCNYLTIDFNWSKCSEMDFDFSNVNHPGQWALEISKQLGARKYINPPGGKDIFIPKEWEEAGIDLVFTKMPQFSYPCSSYKFVENLSILDVLMWNSSEELREYLQAEIVA